MEQVQCTAALHSFVQAMLTQWDKANKPIWLSAWCGDGAEA